MKQPRLAVLGALLLLGACTQLPVDSSGQEQSPTTLQSPEFVAKAIAVAMGDQSVRIAIRNHMRASPMSEHKLQLQEYVAGPLGEILLVAIDRSGVGRTTFLNHLNSLPQIQFYVPSRQQRMSWTGTADIIVSPNLGDGSPGYGYASTGALASLRLEDGKLPGGALFLLQRVEPMHRRVQSQGSTPGNVIQDRHDHDFGGARIYRDGAGNIVRTVEFADTRAVFFDCGPEAITCEEQSGGGGSGGYAPGLYLTRLVNHGVCDNACFMETLEFEFRTRSQLDSDWVISTQLTGIGSVDDRTLYMYISSYRPVGQWVDVGVYELDSFFNDDDAFVCSEYSVNFGVCPTWLPRMQVAPSGSRSFAMCELHPTACAHIPSDLEVSFQDRP